MCNAVGMFIVDVHLSPFPILTRGEVDYNACRLS